MLRTFVHSTHDKQDTLFAEHSFIVWEVTQVSSINIKSSLNQGKFTNFIRKNSVHLSFQFIFTQDPYWLECRNKFHRTNHDNFCFAGIILKVDSSPPNYSITTLDPIIIPTRNSINIVHLTFVSYTWKS